MNHFLSHLGRGSALVTTLLFLVGCDGNPTENHPPPGHTDRFVLFEPTEEISATSYYRGEDGEVVTYGRIRPGQATGNPSYEPTGLRVFGPRGRVTITKEDGGYLVVLDTESETTALAYRIRESAASAELQLYVIDERTGNGMVIGDTVVARIDPAALSRRAATVGSVGSTAGGDPLGICGALEDLAWIPVVVSYATAAGGVVRGALTIARAFPGIPGLAAWGGAVVLAALELQMNELANSSLDAYRSLILGAVANCPDEYGDRERDCPRCDEPLLSCIVDPTSASPTMCCEDGRCRAEEPENRPPPPNSHGDVHILTPDGLAYDFQGAGEYLLMASSDGSVVVQSRQEPWRGSDLATVNTAVAMGVAGDRVGVYLNRSPQLVVNGTPAPFDGARIDLPQGGTILDAAPGYLIRWPDGFLVSVRSEASFLDIGMSRPEGTSLSYAGLLGNMNGDPSDDFFARGGRSLTFPVTFAELYDVFGASWRITREESLFDYAAGESTATFVLPGFPRVPVTVDDLDREVYRHAREACLAAGISDPVLLNSCILDVGLTGENSFVRSAASASAPARELGVDYPDGLIGSYYDGYFDDDFTFFDRNAPVLTRIDTSIDFQDDSASWDLGHVPELADLESFSVVWRGRLIVPRSGTYTLYLNSDDASYLFLGEATRTLSASDATIDNGTAHPLREVSAQVWLEAGDHPLTIVYGEEARNNIVEFSWSSTELDLPKQIVTALGRRVGH